MDFGKEIRNLIRFWKRNLCPIGFWKRNLCPIKKRILIYHCKADIHLCVSDNDNAYHMYAGARAVHMGPFGEIRTKKTAPRGSIKDKKDRASWSESGPDGSL